MAPVRAIRTTMTASLAMTSAARKYLYALNCRHQRWHRWRPSTGSCNSTCSISRSIASIVEIGGASSAVGVFIHTESVPLMDWIPEKHARETVWMSASWMHLSPPRMVCYVRRVYSFEVDIANQKFQFSRCITSAISRMESAMKNSLL